MAQHQAAEHKSTASNTPAALVKPRPKLMLQTALMAKTA